MGREIAYFSMEIGIRDEIKTYSGGLGVLAGDLLRSAADLGEDFIGLTLLYREGYFRQEIKNGNQVEEPEYWDYQGMLEDTGEKVEVQVFGESVNVKLWRYSIEGIKGNVDIIFLDTNLESNSEKAKNLSRQLYCCGDFTRLGKEVLLGVGGCRALQRLGYDPEFYHMNEGHSALLGLEAEGKKVFTTHTPVEAGHDVFDEKMVEEVMPDRTGEIELSFKLNMTELALKESDYVNAVSDRHQRVSSEMFPDYEFDSITNGVHHIKWSSKAFRDLFDSEIDGWRKQPQRLTRVKGVSDEDLWNARNESREKLFSVVEERTGRELVEEAFTVGFARRAAPYKRHCLIFNDQDRLEKLGKKYGGLNIVMAGKAHPEDEHGKDVISRIYRYSDILENVEVVFLPDFSMNEALKLVSGSDLWLNTPERGKEASGTSGMKAALNGTPQLSTPDGWWLEGHLENVTGWAIGEEYVEGKDEDKVDSKSIYSKLDHILSVYHNERTEWIEIMKNCISINGSYFTSQRMLDEYLDKAYVE